VRRFSCVCGFAERVSCSPTFTGITTTFHGKTVSIGPSYEKRGTDSRGEAGILTSMPLMLGLSADPGWGSRNFALWPSTRSGWSAARGGVVQLPCEFPWTRRLPARRFQALSGRLRQYRRPRRILRGLLSSRRRGVVRTRLRLSPVPPRALNLFLPSGLMPSSSRIDLYTAVWIAPVSTMPSTSTTLSGL